jgi:glycosyltransferase involved in cell wall biosynthesis
MAPREADPRIAILLSTFNGAAFLREQLDSMLAQSHDNWVLYWRDDGSSDGTIAILEAFAERAGQGRCVQIDAAPGRLGVTGSFLTLLRAVTEQLGEHDAVAFADQDDIWLPQKLARGTAALAGIGRARPALYCARQILVDAKLKRIGESGAVARWAGFPASLTQNVATGCTVMLNRAAARLVAASKPSPGTLHDWWCYLMVTASGGHVLQDEAAVVLYRQHGGNFVGAPASMSRRATAAIRRGPGVFMSVLRQHVAALLAQPHLMSDQARAEVAQIDRALRGGPARRLAVLRMPGLIRQTWPETLLFRWWFLIG